jgi:multiple sugar transport system ATP-binding protein
VLFGPSSVGKTTALRTIAGLVPTDSGRLEIFGRDMTTAPIAGRGVSMVFQSFALYPHLTVYENFAYPLARGEGRPRGDRPPGQGNGGRC